MKEITQKGILEVICGSMFSGKSEELIRRLKRAELAKLNVITFKHSLDIRSITNREHISSHNGAMHKAIAINEPQEIKQSLSSQTAVIGIDEVQFFPKEIINVICDLINDNKRVIVAGLDLDFKRVPFGCMPILMAIADHVTKLKAICMQCGHDAQFTQRLVNGNPARYHDPIVLVGGNESYQACCRACHRIDQMPIF